MIVSYEGYTGELLKLDLERYTFENGTTLCDSEMVPHYKIEIEVDKLKGFKVSFSDVDFSKLMFLEYRVRGLDGDEDAKKET